MSHLIKIGLLQNQLFSSLVVKELSWYGYTGPKDFRVHV